MRANAILSSLFLLFCITFNTNAQAQVNVNINVNTLPDWAPYDYIPETRYYYIPEIEVYYDIPARMYIYFHKNGWIRSNKLPKRLRHINMYHAHKVSMFDIGPNPYIYFDNHRVKYPKHYHHGHHQPTRVSYVEPPHRNNRNFINHAPVRQPIRKEREYVNPQNFKSNRSEIKSPESKNDFNRGNSKPNIDRNNNSRGNHNANNRANSHPRNESNGIRR